MSDLVTPVLEILVKFAAAVVIVFLVPYIKSKLSKTQLDKLQKAVNIAVVGAEEAGRSGLISKKDKYDYAVDWLESNGYKIDAQMIDAAVWELMNWSKEE